MAFFFLSRGTGARRRVKMRGLNNQSLMSFSSWPLSLNTKSLFIYVAVIIISHVGIFIPFTILLIISSNAEAGDGHAIKP